MTLSLHWCDVLSSTLILSDSPHLCFSSVHSVGSLPSKFPSKEQIIKFKPNKWTMLLKSDIEMSKSNKLCPCRGPLFAVILLRVPKSPPSWTLLYDFSQPHEQDNMCIENSSYDNNWQCIQRGYNLEPYEIMEQKNKTILGNIFSHSEGFTI